ncbi:RNA polymerase sigma factor [Kordiimonas sp.]|uniref:RNA polymerase sigma factor n=1 Tax=Kordiimonas sp. TaxID=1970157 RepID=UPI003A92426E
MVLLQRSPHISLVTDEREERGSARDARPVDMTVQLDEVARKRNIRSLERAIKANQGVLIGWLSKKLNSASDAADVAQDVYIRVYKFAEVEIIDNPQALLFKTAANLAINELKRQGRVLRRQVRTGDDTMADTIEAVPCDGLNPEETVGHRQDVRAMAAAIRQLPEKARAAFVKNRFEDKTYADIARELGVSESTVEKYMMDALKRLRGRLMRKPQASVLPLPRKARRGKS